MLQNSEQKSYELLTDITDSYDDVAELIRRLQKGEQITCLNCRCGKYITYAENLSASCDFICDKCGSVLRISKNIVVE